MFDDESDIVKPGPEMPDNVIDFAAFQQEIVEACRSGEWSEPLALGPTEPPAPLTEEELKEVIENTLMAMISFTAIYRGVIEEINKCLDGPRELGVALRPVIAPMAAEILEIVREGRTRADYMGYAQDTFEVLILEAAAKTMTERAARMRRFGEQFRQQHQ